MAKRLATRLAELDVSLEHPQLVSSPALRARSTAEVYGQQLAPAAAIHIEPRLYEAAPSDVLDLIKDVEDDPELLILFGHNPTFTTVVNRFLDRRGLQDLDNLPTCGTAIVLLDRPFEAVDHASITSIEVDYPKRV